MKCKNTGIQKLTRVETWIEHALSVSVSPSALKHRFLPMCRYIFTHKTLKTNSPTTESNYPITASETDRTNAEQVSQDAGNPPLLDNICTQTTRVQQVWVFWEIMLFTTREQIQCISYKWQTITDRYRFLMKNCAVLLWLISLANETHGIAQVFCFPHDYLHNAFLQSMLFQSSFIEFFSTCLRY